MECLEIIEDTRAYYSDYCKEQILEELFFNAYRTIRNVFIFENFDEYVAQLESDKNENKKEIYWKASYYEKLTDYVKISIAFENFNKAVLLQNGYLVHKIQKNNITKDFYKIQDKGKPVKINDFKEVNDFIQKSRFGKYYLDGLQKGFPTISYSLTLNEFHQEIIGLDSSLLYRLKQLNEKRNKLHFFTDYKGAFEVKSHIEKWKFIKEVAIKTIEERIKKN